MSSSELQVPTTTTQGLRRSQRISVSQASSRGATPVPVASTAATSTGASEMRTTGGRVVKAKGGNRKGGGKEKGKQEKKTKERAEKKAARNGVGRADAGNASTAPPRTTAAPKMSSSIIPAGPPPPPAAPPLPPHHHSPPAQPTTTLSREPHVPRIYQPALQWSSTPASLSFLTHGSLPTTPSTTTIALNILDHTLLPTNWNPLLSHNLLSAASFFFASMVTGNAVSATEVANGCGWVHTTSTALGMWGNSGKEEVLRCLDVSRRRVVEGYGILWERRGNLRGVCGEWEGRVEGLPGKEVVEGWEGGERERGRVHRREVEVRMRGLRFEKWVGGEEDDNEEEVEVVELADEETTKEADVGRKEPILLIELEDFEDFVADNE